MKKLLILILTGLSLIVHSVHADKTPKSEAVAINQMETPPLPNEIIARITRFLSLVDAYNLGLINVRTAQVCLGDTPTLLKSLNYQLFSTIQALFGRCLVFKDRQGSILLT